MPFTKRMMQRLNIDTIWINDIPDTIIIEDIGDDTVTFMVRDLKITILFDDLKGLLRELDVFREMMKSINPVETPPSLPPSSPPSSPSPPTIRIKRVSKGGELP